MGGRARRPSRGSMSRSAYGEKGTRSQSSPVSGFLIEIKIGCYGRTPAVDSLQDRMSRVLLDDWRKATPDIAVCIGS